MTRTETQTVASRAKRRTRRVVAGLVAVGALAGGLALAAPQANAAGSPCKQDCSKTFEVVNQAGGVTATVGTPGWTNPHDDPGLWVKSPASGAVLAGGATHVWDLHQRYILTEPAESVVTYNLNGGQGAQGSVFIDMWADGLFNVGHASCTFSGNPHVQCNIDDSTSVIKVFLVPA